MKKKLLFFILVIVLVVVMVFLTTGCFLSEKKSDVEQDNKDVIATITVKDGNYSKNFEVKCGETPIVEAFSKPGHYLAGYFSEQDGGEKYFDSMGNSTVVWDESKPTVLYAHWDSIYNLNYRSNILYTTPEAFSCVGLHYLSTLNFSNEFCNAIKGNLSAKIRISVSFGLKGAAPRDYFRFYFYDMQDKSTRQLLFQDLSITSGQINYSNYTDFTLSGDFTANMVLSQKVVMYGSAGWEGSIKDWSFRQLVWSAEFVE